MSEDWTPEDVVGGDNSEGKAAVDVTYDKILHVTDRAALFQIDKEEVWVPTSQIYEATAATINMPEWLALEKDLL